MAQSYTWHGEPIISYRGTDVLPGLNLLLLSPSSWQDIAAWQLSASNYSTIQAQLAAKFYQAVSQTVENPIETTGHSLGGALAGFVASVYGLHATTFDHMGFRPAVAKLYQAVTDGVPVDETGLSAVDEFAKATYDGEETPWAPDYSGLAGYALQGEIAGNVRSDSPQGTRAERGPRRMHGRGRRPSRLACARTSG